MPLPKGTRYRAKRLDSNKYLRITFKGNKVLETKVKNI